MIDAAHYIQELPGDGFRAWSLPRLPTSLDVAMTRPLLCLVLGFAASFSVAVASAEENSSATSAALSSDQATTLYLEKLKPLLRQRCFSCHGALKQEGGLRLDTRTAMLDGGDSGPAIVEAQPDDSYLIERLSAEDVDYRMPPEHEAEPLSAAEIAAITQWIAAGAPAPAEEQPEADPKDHWAFQPIVRPEIPKVVNQEWVRNPIDAFIAAKHESQGLTPQESAPPLVLLRRLYFDLIGLPPTPEEIAAFAAEPTEEKYQEVVDRLLADPRHGERWARHWMDIWRYSDWWGLGEQMRNSHPLIWHWRDWMVESLNEDLPYDQMVRQMLAADELYPTDLAKLRATGYLVRNYFIFNRHQWMDETVEHVSKGLLGLTMNCAKCHDHKYDPLAQTDYYQMRAFFEPYHVRVDMLPGELDVSKDGIPRAYDGEIETPTYVFIRGEEGRPDKSTVMTPAVPEILAFDELAIESVSLPREAWQPGRRDFVMAAYLEAAQKKVESAAIAVANADEALRLAKQQASESLAQATNIDDHDDSAETGLVLAEDFQTLDESRWRLFGGEWKHEPGRLEQKLDGPTRSVLRWQGTPPRDFEATFKFTIRGGSQWRSVCLAFDSTASDPSQDMSASEQTVYVSAHEGGAKVQAAFCQEGQWQYPSEGRQARSIELDRQYTLQVQVRDNLINASLDGEPVLSYRTPLPRKEGALHLHTFDALALFHQFTIRPLPKEVPLREPGGAPPLDPLAILEQAELAHRTATLAKDVAKAELVSIERRIRAIQAAEEDSFTRVAAIRAEQEVALLKAMHEVASAELRLKQATGDKRKPIEKELTSSKEALQKAEEALKSAIDPKDSFTMLEGAKWTPTRFLTSTADDPPVEFQPQSTGRRTALAKWITDERNPLTARVAVNHLWNRHFGAPLVPTVFDFGRNGTPPPNPELLDWLACELIESGWSMKHLHRLIVSSQTYRMASSSAGQDTNLAKDPDNKHWWRRNPLRLESQAVRDAILSLAATLDETRGGPPVQPKDQATSKRRSLYFFHSNNDRNLFLTTFDEAMVKECYVRDQSIVPQQALALTNSSLVLEASQQIAARLSKSAKEDEDFIRESFRVLLGATASEQEIEVSRKAFARWQELAEKNETGMAPRAHFIWALLNHNDFVTLR